MLNDKLFNFDRVITNILCHFEFEEKSSFWKKKGLSADIVKWGRYMYKKRGVKEY